MQEKTYPNPIIVKFEDIDTVSNDGKFVTFLFTNGNKKQFSQLAYNLPEFEPKVTDTDYDLPETFISQEGFGTLQIVYPTVLDQDNHLIIIQALFDTTPPSSISQDVNVTNAKLNVNVTNGKELLFAINTRTAGAQYIPANSMVIQLIAKTGTFSVNGQTFPFMDASGINRNDFVLEAPFGFYNSDVLYNVDAASEVIEIVRTI